MMSKILLHAKGPEKFFVVGLSKPKRKIKGGDRQAETGAKCP
jgi:hypothetical protein